MKIAVLMACYNRVATTLRCLGSLFSQDCPCELHVFLVDDKSPDQTGIKVKAAFPQVEVIDSPGGLYWAKSMHLAWKSASVSGKFDAFLWLNDDVDLKTNAVAALLDDYRKCGGGKCVIVGTCSSNSDGTEYSYGATDSADGHIVPKGEPQKAEGWFSGNIVLVPHCVYETVGMISGEYSHARADYDYAERLKEAEVPFFASSYYLGVCKNDFKEKLGCLSCAQRLGMLWRPGYWNLKDLWRIRSRYHGGMRAIVSCVHLVFDVVKG